MPSTTTTVLINEEVIPVNRTQMPAGTVVVHGIHVLHVQLAVIVVTIVTRKDTGKVFAILNQPHQLLHHWELSVNLIMTLSLINHCSPD